MNAFAPGQLRHQRFRVAAAGAVLDRAPQHRLLRRGTTPCDSMNTASCCWSPPCALSTGCGLLDTDSPTSSSPGDVETPAGAQARRVGAIADLAFAQDGDGTQFEDGQILLTGLMSDEFVLSTTPPTEQEIDQRRVFENNGTVSTCFTTCTGPAPRRRPRPRPCGICAPSPTRTARHRRDAEPGGLHLHLLRRRASAPACRSASWKATRSSSASRRPRSEIFQTAVARFDAALAEPGVSTAERGAGDHQPRRGGQGRAPCSTADASRKRPQQWRRPDRVPVRDRARGQPAAAAERDLVLQPACSGRCRIWRAASACRYRTAEDPRVPFFDEESAGLDSTTISTPCSSTRTPAHRWPWPTGSRPG